MKPSKPKWSGGARGGNLKSALKAWNAKAAPDWLPK
jgi:hypothetical protein